MVVDLCLPKVLLIGDSISEGYTGPVKRLLEGLADVCRAPVNCGPTWFGIEHIREWLGDTRWDVTHFNWGIWDMHQMCGDEIVAGGRIRTTPEQYESNLRQLVSILKSTGAALIWASTTPVHPVRDPAFGVNAVDGENVPKYNAVAARVMAENEIPIDDLYSLALPNADELRKGDSIHFTDEGYEVLARQVADSIRRELA